MRKFHFVVFKKKNFFAKNNFLGGGNILLKNKTGVLCTKQKQMDLKLSVIIDFQ